MCHRDQSGWFGYKKTLLRLQTIKIVPFKKTALVREHCSGHQARNSRVWDGVSEQNRLQSRKRIFFKVCREADKGENEIMEERFSERRFSLLFHIQDLRPLHQPRS